MKYVDNKFCYQIQSNNKGCQLWSSMAFVLRPQLPNNGPVILCSSLILVIEGSVEVIGIFSRTDDHVSCIRFYFGLYLVNITPHSCRFGFHFTMRWEPVTSWHHTNFYLSQFHSLAKNFPELCLTVVYIVNEAFNFQLFWLLNLLKFFSHFSSKRKAFTIMKEKKRLCFFSRRISELKNWPKENIDYCIGLPCEAKAYIFQPIFFSGSLWRRIRGNNDKWKKAFG